MIHKIMYVWSQVKKQLQKKAQVDKQERTVSIGE